MNRKLKTEELNRLNVAAFKAEKKFPITVVLDNIRSLNNVGAIFRTCDALAVEHLYLCGITPAPPHREIEKTALGATLSVSWSYEKDILSLVENLKAKDYKIAAIEQTTDSIALNEFKLEENRRYAVIFGNEVKGVQQEVVDASDCCIEIPQFGTKHSFNVSVGAGIVLWEMVSRFL